MREPHEIELRRYGPAFAEIVSAMRHVLLVEDDGVLRKHLARLLARAGCHVTTAATCAEARHALRHGSYELLLLDLQLPDGDGVELLTRLDPQERPRRIIGMTAYSSAANARRLDELCVEQLLAKPLDCGEIMRLVSAAV